MGVSQMKLGPIEVISTNVPNLNASVAAPSIDHFSFVTVLCGGDGDFRTTCTSSFHERLVGQLLLHADFFGVHVPLADSSVLAACYEEMIFFWVPLSIIDTGNVTFGVRHVKQIHVAPDSSFLTHALRIVYFGLVIAATAEEMRPVRIERQCAHWMAVKRLEVFERLQVAIHGSEIPNLHPVV